MPTHSTSGRRSGKWNAMLARLDLVPGILVAEPEAAERLRADRPDRDVREDTGAPGVVRVYQFRNLPLHLWTRAERRREARRCR